MIRMLAVAAVASTVLAAVASGGGASPGSSADGAEAGSAGAEGGAAGRARPAPNRLWYKLSVDYRGRQLVTRKSRPTDRANRSERVHPGAKLTVEDGFVSEFSFVPETALLLKRRQDGAFSILDNRPLIGFKAGPYLRATRSTAPGCTPYTQRWLVRKFEDFTTSIGAKPSGKGFTRITIGGPPPHLPRANVTSVLEEDAWRCNWTEQDEADGVGDGLPTFAYRNDFGGHQLTPAGEKPLLVGDEKDVYPEKRRSEPVRPPQLLMDDWHDTFAEIDLAPVRFGKPSFKRGVDIKREHVRQEDSGWFVTEIKTLVEEHWDFHFIRCSKPRPC